ncbi:uncharacterized protein LOC131951392 [Physella acuta]|uniref:uncharacterized protein LOC131951392 n=1 Tax=Physella acuta TaxID=109671 RepID=UPI0027DAEE80|nr:uncharacterized protein LOC131951392 [Physella acuta]
MMMLQLTVFVFLSNILSFGCVDIYPIQTFDNSTFNHTKRSFADGRTNYPIPYTGEIRFPMYDGKEVIIEGVRTSSSNRFIVALCESANCNADQQMHMSVRKNTGKIHISSKRNNMWGPEYTFEAASLMTGTEIRIKLIIHDIKIKIYFKDVFLTDLSLRGVNKQTIKYVSVRESIFVEWILYSITFPGSTLPVKRWPAGEKIIIRGTPTRNTLFSVDLACIGGGKSDLAVLFRVGFVDGINVNTVFINHRFNGEYGALASIKTDFPFQVNVPFTMVWVLRPPLLQITVTKAGSSGTKDYSKTNLNSCYNQIEHWGRVTMSQFHMT